MVSANDEAEPCPSSVVQYHVIFLAARTASLSMNISLSQNQTPDFVKHRCDSLDLYACRNRLFGTLNRLLLYFQHSLSATLFTSAGKTSRQ